MTKVNSGRLLAAFPCDILRLMRIHPSVVILVAVSAALAAAGCSEAGALKSKKIAGFSGGIVTDTEFSRAVSALPERVRAVALRQKKDFLESYITEKLLCREAEKKGIQHLNDVRDLLAQARQKILVAKLIEREIESRAKVSDDEVKAHYDNHQDEFMNPFRVRAEHILLRSREEAERAAADIKGGADFVVIAKERSLDPTAARGGDLGFFSKGQLIPEIEEAAFALEKGAMSGIIQTAFGFHLIKVTDVAEPSLKDFASVAKELHEKLLIEKKSRLFEEWTGRIKSDAKISIDETLLEEIGSEAVSPGAAAPAAPAVS